MDENRSLQTIDGPEISDSAKRYAASSRSENTRLAYQKAWNRFTTWCDNENRQSLPASVGTTIEYLTYMADALFKLSSIEVNRSAISAAHQAKKLKDPTKSEDVRLIMSGIARKIGEPPVKKSPLEMKELLLISRSMPDTLLARRDMAVLLIGLSGAFRRSELVALDVSDIKFGPDGIKITVKRGKTDQEGHGMVKNIPSVASEIDPVTALRTWLSCSGIANGAVFRRIDRWDNLATDRLKPQAVAMIVKRCALMAGLDSVNLSGHSLRSGFVTAAADAGVPTWAIKQQTGHKSEVIVQGYIRNAGRGAESTVRAIFKETK